MKNYKEKLFYYFKNKSDTDTDPDPLELIFTKDEIKTIKLQDYSLTSEKIKNMIFNLDFITQTSEVQHQLSSQENVETQTQTQTQTKSDYNIIISLNKIKEILKKFIKYQFKNFDFINTINDQTNYDKYTFKLNDLLSFLPNIFYINYYSSTYCINFKSNELNKSLIFVYIHNIQKFILIPKFMVFYLYNDFLMYDLNLNILNQNKKSHHIDDKVTELEDNLFVKIITNNFSVDDFKLFELNLICNEVKSENVTGSYLSALIYFYRFMDQMEWSPNYLILMGYLISNLHEIINTLNFDNHNNLIRNVQTLENLQRKYLKYKTKYLNLKKIYFNKYS